MSDERIDPKLDRALATIAASARGDQPAPAWVLALMVDVHKLVAEVRSINQTLLRMDTRDRARAEIGEVKKP